MGLEKLFYWNFGFVLTPSRCCVRLITNLNCRNGFTRASVNDTTLRDLNFLVVNYVINFFTTKSLQLYVE